MNGGKRILFAIAVLAAGALALAQLKPDEIAQDKAWEEFLATAEIKAAEQFKGSEAVTSPYRLTLEKDGQTRSAFWKNPEGRMSGYIEGWKFEIAAYRIDRLLGLHMVAPTIERRYNENRGSLQLGAEYKMPYKRMLDDKSIKAPGGLKGVIYNRAIYLQRTFDNLIANIDRHANNILLTDDWRMILIDHSRSFRTGSAGEKLIYTEKHREGDRSVKALPGAFLERLKTLTAEEIKAAVGEYLTEDEVKAVMLRRDLILKDIEARIAKLGRPEVIY
jgi:hypothetical protein